ncbi:MAG: hypothetical protein ACK4ZJ_19460, partial [Allorhizobium sp.]
MNELRASIQRLCQSTNPLGKCMVRTRRRRRRRRRCLPERVLSTGAGAQEYVHEDMVAMEQELESWKAEHRKMCEVRDARTHSRTWLRRVTPPDAAQALEEQERETERSLQPLYQQLHDVEDRVQQMGLLVNAAKVRIAK